MPAALSLLSMTVNRGFVLMGIGPKVRLCFGFPGMENPPSGHVEQCTDICTILYSVFFILLMYYLLTYLVSSHNMQYMCFIIFWDTCC